LKDIPNGEYVTRIIDNSEPNAGKRGTLERLLRLRTSPKMDIPSIWKYLTMWTLLFSTLFQTANSKWK